MTFMKHGLAAGLISALMAAAHAAPVSGQGTWQNSLHARDALGQAVGLSDAGAMYFYDSTVNITWRVDMGAGGIKTWDDAIAWAAGLTDLGAAGDWRLPQIIDSGTPGCNFGSSGGTDCGYNVQTQVGNAYSEWAHLYHVTLGNLAVYDLNGHLRNGAVGVDWGLTNTAYFQNMPTQGYWSGTTSLLNPAYAWTFHTYDGIQRTYHKQGAWSNLPVSGDWAAVAVRNGDVLRATAVPEPGGLVLVLTALGAMAGLGRLGQRNGSGTRFRMSSYAG